MRYYLDTEFDGFGGPLISLALVREDGASVYYVLSVTAFDPWVQANVLPILWDSKPRDRLILLGASGRQAAAEDIARFLAGDLQPVIIADWPADIRYFCELIEFPDGNMAPIPRLTFELIRVDAYPTDLEGAVQHNAWWDAMALRHTLKGLLR